MKQTATRRMGPLKESERQTICHGLRVAADQFDKDAKVLAAEFGNTGRSVTTFRQQAETTRLWADLIEEAEEVIIR